MDLSLSTHLQWAPSVGVILQTQFVPICCCNISGQTQFVLNCCNISGQTENSVKQTGFLQVLLSFSSHFLLLDSLYVLAGQIRGQMSVCRAWNALPNNVEHKVEAIMEHFGPPPVVPISCRHHDHSTILIILNQQHCLQRGLLIIATMGTTRHVM